MQNKKIYKNINYFILNPKLLRKQANLFKYFILILTVIALSIFSLPNLKSIVTVYAQLEEKDIEFQQSYWTESSQSVSTASSDQIESSTTTDITKKIEKEVEPGEGISTLAIELVNTARTDITAVKGFLTLPKGFQDAADVNIIKPNTNNTSKRIINFDNISTASHNSIVRAGDLFTLFFDINILNDTYIGQYNSSLKIVYSKVLEKGKITSVIPIEFDIPGKVILDASLVKNNKETQLITGQYHEINLVIRNKGSSYASGVIATIKGFEKPTNVSDSQTNMLPSSFIPAVNTGNRTFNIGTMPPGSSVIIKPVIYIANSAKESIQNLILGLAYGDSYGNKQEFESSIGIIVSPMPEASNFNVIPIFENVPIFESNNNNNNAVILTAGTIEDLKFRVKNNAKNFSNPLTDLVVNLNVSPKESIEILGNSRWTFDSMNPQSYYDLDTKIFAAEQIANTPVEFSITIDYISNQELKKESLFLGAYIEGKIRITGHDFEIRKVGDIPNFSGNLLNEGNIRALFTKVDLLNLKLISNLINNNNNSDNNGHKGNAILLSRPQEQYLGDLDANSPLPFSIPIDLNANAIPGKYLFTLNVTYSDDLRQIHHAVINGTADVNLPKESESESQSFGIIDVITKNYIMLIIVIAIIITAATIIGIFYAKRRKKSSSFKFGIGKENDEMKSKDNSLFENTSTLFDIEKDNEK
ncbi:MAG: COG1361 S-layer family protein [Deltaproteobacteria bacterium]